MVLPMVLPMVSARFGSSFHVSQSLPRTSVASAEKVFSWIPNPMDLTALGCPGSISISCKEHNGRCGIYDDKNGDLIVIKVIQIISNSDKIKIFLTT